MLTRFKAAAAPVAIAALSSGSLHAAEGVKSLDQFDVSQYQNGWSAEAILDTEVYGEDGEDVGEVANIVINSSDGQIDRLIIETDNWLDLGDRMISVPWDKVDITPDEDGIVAQVDEDHMNDFSLFASDDVDTDSKSFRASELLGKYVSLEDNDKYGYVTDLVFDQKGRLQATAVSTDVLYGDSNFTGGYYAYPYYGYDDDYGLSDDTEVYALPYTQKQADEYGTFDYEAFEDASV